MVNVKISTHWNRYLSLFPASEKDVYFTEEYIRLYETESEKALCFIYTDGNRVLLFPFLTRSFEFEEKIYRDFETAYGYGGPIYNTDNENFIAKALKLFKTYCKEEGYVAGFVRFHPLLANIQCFDQIGKLQPERQTVAINLDQSIEKVWMNEIHTKNRNVIKKGERSGLKFEADYEYKHLRDFRKLYDSTMEKLSADDFYYFNDTYYENLVRNIPGSFLGCVFKETQLVSAAIFFFGNHWGHYHLSGSDRSQLAHSPNNFMLWEAAKELKKQGVKQFHLGGGTNSKEDNSLFLFKKKFSQSLHQFYIGKLIFNEKLYNNICGNWERENPEKVEIYCHHLLKYKY